MHLQTLAVTLWEAAGGKNSDRTPNNGFPLGSTLGYTEWLWWRVTWICGFVRGRIYCWRCRKRYFWFWCERMDVCFCINIILSKKKEKIVTPPLASPLIKHSLLFRPAVIYISRLALYQKSVTARLFHRYNRMINTRNEYQDQWSRFHAHHCPQCKICPLPSGRDFIAGSSYSGVCRRHGTGTRRKKVPAFLGEGDFLVAQRSLWEQLIISSVLIRGDKKIKENSGQLSGPRPVHNSRALHICGNGKRQD